MTPGGALPLRSAKGGTQKLGPRRPVFGEDLEITKVGRSRKKWGKELYALGVV